MKKILKKLLAMLKKNLSYKIVALIFAFLLWSTLMSNPSTMRTITIRDVPISYVGYEELTAKGLMVDMSDAGFRETVDVQLTVSNRYYSSVSQSSINVTADLSAVSSTGQKTVGLNAALTSGITASNIKMSAEQVNLTIDNIAEKEIPVTCEVQGSAADGYYAFEPVLESNSVTIKGAASKINDVTRAVCYVPISGLKSDVRATYLLTLYNSEGEQVSSDVLTSTMPSTIVTVKVLPTKVVPVEYEDLNKAITNVQSGYTVAGLELSPSSVRIAAQADVLAGIDSVQLKSINVNNANSSVLVDGALTEIEGVTFIDGSKVEVYVQIEEEQAEKTFRNLPIAIKRLGDGLNAKLESIEVNATVSGERSEIKELSESDISLSVDLSELKKGTHTVSIVVGDLVQDSVKVQLSVSNVKVTITDAQ